MVSEQGSDKNISISDRGCRMEDGEYCTLRSSINCILYQY